MEIIEEASTQTGWSASSHPARCSFRLTSTAVLVSLQTLGSPLRPTWRLVAGTAESETPPLGLTERMCPREHHAVLQQVFKMRTYSTCCSVTMVYRLHVSVATTSPLMHGCGGFYQMFSEYQVRLLFNLIQLLFHHLTFVTVLCVSLSLSLSLQASIHLPSPLPHSHPPLTDEEEESYVFLTPLSINPPAGKQIHKFQQNE